MRSGERAKASTASYRIAGVATTPAGIVPCGRPCTFRDVWRCGRDRADCFTDKYRLATLRQWCQQHRGQPRSRVRCAPGSVSDALADGPSRNRSSACTELPVQWPRNYVASVLQNGAEIKVSLRTDVCPGGCTAFLTGRVSNRSVFIQFPHGDIVDGPWIQELLPSGAFVTIAGEANGDEANDVIEGRLSGDIVYYAPGLRTNPIRCSREDHTFRLSRR